MELRQMTYFLAVAQDLSFSRAASRLHVTQPTVSQQVQALEEELGCRLFERDRRRVQLTAAGRLFAVYARQALAAAEEARQHLHDIHALEVGRVQLGALPAAVCGWLPEVLARLRREQPGIEVYVVEAGTGDVLAALAAGSLDLGIVTLPVDLTRFAVHAAREEQVLLTVGRDHPLARQRGPVSLREVAHEPFIAYEENTGLHAVVAEACRRAGFQPHVVMRTLRTESVKRFVAAGLGVGLLPAEAAGPEDGQRLHLLPVRECPVRSIGLVSRRGAPPTSVAQRLALVIERELAVRTPAPAAPPS